MVATHAITASYTNWHSHIHTFRWLNPLSQMHTALLLPHTSHSQTTWPVTQASFSPPSWFYTASTDSPTAGFRWISYICIFLDTCWLPSSWCPHVSESVPVLEGWAVTLHHCTAAIFFYHVFYKQIYFLSFCIYVCVFFPSPEMKCFVRFLWPCACLSWVGQKGAAEQS